MAAAAGASPYRERLVRFYTVYQKEKLGDVDGLLEKSRGKEERLFEKLVDKYGPEPSNEQVQQALHVGDGVSAKAAEAKVVEAKSPVKTKKVEEKVSLSPMKENKEEKKARKEEEKEKRREEKEEKKRNLLELFTPRNRLVRFYEKYAPDKVGDVDKLVAKIETDPKQEEMLFKMLVKKYGPEPEVEGIDEEEEEEEAEEVEEVTKTSSAAKAAPAAAAVSHSGTEKKDFPGLREILYCPVNGIPAEYCEFFTDSFSQALPWLAETSPQMVLLTQGKVTVEQHIRSLAEKHKLDLTKPLKALAESLPQKGGAPPPVAVEGAATAAGVTFAAAAPQPKKKGEKETRVYIELNQRQKRKFVTSLLGMDEFEKIVKIKDAAKMMGKKFASGASVTENAAGKKCIEIQGDVMYDLPDFLVEIGIPKDAIYIVDKTTKTPAFGSSGASATKAAGKPSSGKNGTRPKTGAAAATDAVEKEEEDDEE